jgi:hypothetical protein
VLICAGWDRAPADYRPSAGWVQVVRAGHSRKTNYSTRRGHKPLLRHAYVLEPVVRKNSIRLPSDRDVGTYLFGLRDLENPGSQLGWQKIPLSLTDPVPS